MKKSLLLLAAALFWNAAYAAHEGFLTKHLEIEQQQNAPRKEAAENSLIFGYCGDLYTGLGTGAANGTLSGAIEIPAETAASWKGAKITAVRIGFGSSSNKTATLFIARSIGSKNLYTQQITVNNNSWNEVQLTTPFEIDGNSLAIGYHSNIKSTSDYPIGIDGKTTSNQLGGWIAINGSWQNIASSYGSICIQLVISGDALPSNSAAVTTLTAPATVKPDASFFVTAQIINTGTSPITSVGATAKVGDTDFNTPEIRLTPSSIATGSSGTLTVSGLSSSVEGAGIPVSININKVNGGDNENPSGSATTSVMCIENGFQRNVVVEEWTGNWCGFCPRGIVGMEYMANKYPDTFIGIAVHSASSPGGSGEPMYTSSYLPFLNKYCDGFPGCIMNRNTDLILDPNSQDLAAAYNSVAQSPSFAKVNLEAVYYDDDPGMIHVYSNTIFALPPSDTYKLAFVITEDGVGPYYQTNYYANNSYGAMGGWESKPSRVSTDFDHVARNIQTVWGIDNSLPSSLEKNKYYSYSTSFSSKDVDDLSKCHVVALLINASTGQIENAAKVSLSNQAGVNDIDADGSVAVSVEGDKLFISGEYTSCQIYTVDGSAVKEAHGQSSLTLPAGLYIVRINTANGGSVTKKIFVK